MVKIEMEIIGKMPPCFEISDFLWGKDADINSDGNSETPDSTTWNELTLTLRSDTTQSISIDPIEGSSNPLELRATNNELAQLVLSFLQKYGTVK